MPVSPDRVVITSGTSEGIELALTALAEAGDEVLVPVPTYPLYTAVLAKIGARAVFYRTDPDRGWMPDVDHVRSLITPATRALVVIDPNNPTGATYSADDAPRACRAGRPAQLSRSSPTRSTPISPLTVPSGDCHRLSGCPGHLLLVALESVPRARLAGRLDGGRQHAAHGRCARGDQEAGGWPAVRDRTDGIRDCRRAQRRSVASAGVSRRASAPCRADDSRLNAIEGITSVAPTAAFYAMPRSRFRPARPMRITCSGSCARPGSSASTAPGSAPVPRTASSASSSSRRPKSCRESTMTSRRSRKRFLRR